MALWTAHPRPARPSRLPLAPTIVCVVCFSLPAIAQTTSPPVDWSETNIGAAIGAWSYNDDGFQVEGTGADIWGTADSFHFVYQQVDGDTEFRARILSVTGTDAWTKVGLMIRNSLDPSSAHHFLLTSRARGLAYQRRLTTGATSLHTALGDGTGPEWFRMIRAGGTVELSMSSDGVNWEQVATIDWPTGPTFIGFAVTSHGAPDPGTGLLDHVALSRPGRTAPAVSVILPSSGETVPAGQPYPIRWEANDSENDIVSFDVYSGSGTGSVTPLFEPIAGCTTMDPSVRQCTWTNPGPSGDRTYVLVVATDLRSNEGRAQSGAFTIGTATGTLPPGWSDTDVGAVSSAGTASFSNGTFIVSGSGADIWDTADEFHFVHQTLSGDFVVTARVTSIEYVSAWTKAGLMIREGLSAGARHASFFATPSTEKGTAFQRRLTTGGFSTHTTGPAYAPPVWLKLSRRGPSVTAYYRHRITDPWQFLYYEVIDGLADTLDVGLAVSSHRDGTIATAQFTDVTVEPLQPWMVGQIASNGYASYDGVIYYLSGGGSDIWGTGDALYYGFLPWTGDGTMTARVREIDPSNVWAKAGVMFRESLTPGSKHVFALLSSGKGAWMQYRPTTDGQSASATGISGRAPGWLRLTRSGDTFSGSLSTDGVTWQAIGSVTVPMADTVYVGFVHTSHDSDDPGQAAFDDLSVRP